MNILRIKKVTTTLLFVWVTSAAFAQLNPLSTTYFQNQYIANPAFAGINKGWELNGAFKAMWTVIDGTPTILTTSATYGSENKKSGFGIQITNDVAGVVNHIGGKLTYAYHLPLRSNNNAFIDLGVSGSIINESIKMNKVIAEIDEETIAQFNKRGVAFDADFGAAYRSDNLTIQGAIPNLRMFFDKDYNKNISDASKFMVAASYKINHLNWATSLEPKVVYRSVQNYGDIFDAGFNLSMLDNKLIFSPMYHSTKSVSIGLGTLHKERLNIMAYYTTNTSQFQGYSNGEVEISVRYNFRSIY